MFQTILNIYLNVIAINISFLIVFSIIEWIASKRKNVEIIDFEKVPLLMSKPNLVFFSVNSFIPLMQVLILVVNIAVTFYYIYFLIIKLIKK